MFTAMKGKFHSPERRLSLLQRGGFHQGAPHSWRNRRLLGAGRGGSLLTAPRLSSAEVEDRELEFKSRA